MPPKQIDYRVGDVVMLCFQLREDKSRCLDHPGLILAIYTNSEGEKIYTVAQITSTDRRGQFVGRWVERNSPAGKSMKLKNDSFIHLQNIANVTTIRRAMGVCSIMPEISQIYSTNGITY